MKSDKLSGHLSIAGAYTIFGLNIVFCKDIANSAAVSPIVLFTLRALGASALFWLLSIFTPKEKVERGDFPKIAAASFVGLFVPQLTFLKAITMATTIDTAIMGIPWRTDYRQEGRGSGAEFCRSHIPYFQLGPYRRCFGHISFGDSFPAAELPEFLALPWSFPAPDLEIQRSDLLEMDIPVLVAAVAAFFIQGSCDY